MKNLRILFAIIVTSILALAVRAEETDKLAAILIPGEDWQPVVEGLGFADGLSCDAPTGNIYFSDLKAKAPEKPATYMLTPEGIRTKVFDGAHSGTRPSGDYKTLFAIGAKKIVAYVLPGGPETVIAENIGTNDLVATREGRIYFTGNGKGQVSMVDVKTKEVKIVDAGNLKNPNGIGLSPDQKTLIVSDYGGVNVWTFTIQPDGSLTDRKPAMTMKAPEKKPDVAGGDGMAIDAAGRAYVTTAMGLQIFAPSGELLGILPKPKSASPLVSCTFGGKDLNYLYIANGDTIYRRKTQARGVAFLEQK
jgi:enterochelin esterase family protein